MQIQNRTFLVTGGGSGLGAATAQLLVESGAAVVIADIDAERGRQWAAELGEQAQFVETDVTRETSVQRAVDQAQAVSGQLAGVVHCAGIAIAKKLIGRSGVHDMASFTKVMEVNVIGTFNVSRLAAAAMIGNEAEADGERGIIINTASIAAFDGQVGQVAYAASKGGVVGMTLPLARELAQKGIRVMAIAPGIFDTLMMAGLPEAARKSLGEQIPFPSRLGKPTEYAALVKHVIENVMFNGEVIRLDGAIRMPPR